ncbi:MAG: hypothetical protein J6Y15_05000 [Bacteroidaceae bacterium]|nr:hypothetical protein [Bacteroidaceae bacterium]
MKNKFLVTYDTVIDKGLQIVIWADSRADVKPMLKRHLGSAMFHIKSITPQDVKSVAPYMTKFVEVQ